MTGIKGINFPAGNNPRLKCESGERVKPIQTTVVLSLKEKTKIEFFYLGCVKAFKAFKQPSFIKIKLWVDGWATIWVY